MKIVVVGGGGRIGSRLVTTLTHDGHEVVAASRRSGVDAVTGEGLAEALRGAAVVLDVSNSPSFEDAAVVKFFKASTRNLLACEAAAGVRHHVVLSVVGTERLLRSGYFRAKFAQERLIKDSGVPCSIVRGTQFFEFLKGIADAATHGTAVRVPPVLIQPIAPDDVARTVAKIAMGTPLNGTVEIGGPEPFYLSTLIQRVLGARNDPREVVADPYARYFGAELNERSLVAGDEAELGEIRFDDWLSRLHTPFRITVSRQSEPPQASECRSRKTNFDSAKCRLDQSCCWAMLRCSASKGLLRHPGQVYAPAGSIERGHTRRLDRDVPIARGAIQCVDGSGAAWPGEAAAQDVQRDHRR